MSVHPLREVARWLRASMAEADRSLPELLPLSGARLEQELEERPDLCTAGMMERLLEIASDARADFPHRAHELTSVVVACAPRVVAPALVDATILRHQQGRAWQEHARALSGIRRIWEARAAIARARELFECDPGSGWHVAVADLDDAPMLYALGAREEALQMARCAARQFELHGSHEHYVEARILEMWMLWERGDRAAATAVGWAMVDAASHRGDGTLTAHIAMKIAQLQLWHGYPEEGWKLYGDVLNQFTGAGRRSEAIRARWTLAEAAVARGNLPEAISLYYMVHAELLAIGAVFQAAPLAATEVLELLIAAGRHGEASRFIETLVTAYDREGMPRNVLEAFTRLRAIAVEGRLAHQHVAAVRSFVEELRQQPAARLWSLW